MAIITYCVCKSRCDAFCVFFGKNRKAVVTKEEKKIVLWFFMADFLMFPLIPLWIFQLKHSKYLLPITRKAFVVQSIGKYRVWQSRQITHSSSHKRMQGGSQNVVMDLWRNDIGFDVKTQRKSDNVRDDMRRWKT